MQKLKIAIVILIALGAFALGYFVAKPAKVANDTSAQTVIAEYKSKAEAAEAEAKDLQGKQIEMESQRKSAEVARAEDKRKLSELKAKLATQDEGAAPPVGIDTRDEYIAGLEKYSADLEKDKVGMSNEIETLKVANARLSISVDANQKAFDTYKLSKETQIAAMQSEIGKGKLKAFAYGFGAGVLADRGLTIAYRLRF